MKHFIGIDIGTSGTKAVLFSNQGLELADSKVRYPLLRPQSKWAEQNPDDYFFATVSCLEKLAKDNPLIINSVKGIGIAGQMHGLVLLDEKDEILRPAIIWCDNRTDEEVKEIKMTFGDNILEITGSQPTAAFTLAKLLWVKKHEPEIFNKINKILLPKDYVCYRLTGTFTSDYSDMSGTQLIDINTLDYNEEILNYLGISKSMLPKIISSIESRGVLKQGICRMLGLPEGISVAGGSGDQAASGFGSASLEEGQFSISLGSSGVVFTPTKLIIDETGAIQTFAYYDKNIYHIMGVTQGCAASFAWLKDTVYPRGTAFASINKEVEQVKKIEDKPIFLPYLQGERTPILDPNARGLIFGLTKDTARKDIAYSVFEGVAFSLLHAMDSIERLGINPDYISVTGGISKNDTFVQLLSNVLQKSLVVADVDETGCLGAAMMAMLCTRQVKNIEELLNTIEKPKTKIYNPQTNDQEVYKKRYRLYKELYQAIKHLY